MKKVLILFSKSDWKTSTPPKDKAYRYSYEYFYTLCRKNNIQVYRASYEWYDFKKKIFKYAWIFESAGNNWQRVRNIKPDFIYDKTKARPEIFYKKDLIGLDYPFINHLEFTKIVDNKYTNSLMFFRWSKKAWLAHNQKEMKKIIRSIKTSKIVLKPLRQSGGEGVQILNKADASKCPNFNQTHLLQEFIDSSEGVPGVVKGIHDLRLIMVNNELIYSLIRQPAKGSYLANLAQGGTVTFIPLNKVPRSVFPIINQAKKLFESFRPRIFSIDVMFDKKKKPWVVELNSMPGLYFSPKGNRYMEKMYAALLKVFQARLKDLSGKKI
ncbi:MAG: Prokaryotic glutathione synthetase, ATP-grasp domain family [Candidatus Moranbacteria bacterium GW2011_GWC1_45_18]|nr:MAG: Prokaryotic glutathione synthetase, ATP-grasp domain family [Parcubacteria group bacterium GW2011_GWD1_38_16]KKR44122.1 MAG: Prokaryotic glutathione synthetase, ATP-grasp domain family [Candidatus Moranbacteria bacterium GW2011_GWC2_40_12]KKT33465.1 MAG: Prokaryotic glutathione synthetase, ATP-grasp domain family [Candidatus Moranbacteria bacterium GW2011_GWF2_44_10]KKT71716.1 MAG: Prokaryotic glutathione synthetase, ATP-grasp domain family [Candidatus Moranbacteria bacterium GW2011_GWF1